jgi:hypothetical protein
VSMKVISMLSRPARNHVSPVANAGVLALFVLAFWPDYLAAQGLPVDSGSHIPVALWFVGAGLLGLVMAYGILHNKKRTRAEQQRTEQATKSLYREEERDRAGSGADL